MSIFIPLAGKKNKGMVTLLDLEDWEHLSLNRWYTDRDGYAISGAQRQLRMHRVVLGRALGRTLETNEHVDHVNRDRLDNRRENLRLVTSQQNAFNRTGSGSGYKGVRYPRGRAKAYYAAVRIDGVRHILGPFYEEILASYAADVLFRIHHGEFAALNHPDVKYSLEEVKSWAKPRKVLPPKESFYARSKSGFRGVYPHGKKWIARLTYKKITTEGVMRADAADAARDYDAMLMERWGDARRLNFPHTNG